MCQVTSTRDIDMEDIALHTLARVIISHTKHQDVFKISPLPLFFIHSFDKIH